jgi:protein-tyrosine-phosphatase
MAIPLFVCHANCCRSVLACALYHHLCADAPAWSAGLEPGPALNDRATAMLARWRIDAARYQPRQLDRALCVRADAIFAMSPAYVHRLLVDHGVDLANRTYLFADPFTLPRSFAHGEYRVPDPSFDPRPVEELVREFAWMRERVLQIRLALLGDGRPMVPAVEYWPLCQSVDPRGH